MDDAGTQPLVVVRRRLFSEDERQDEERKLATNGADKEADTITISWDSDSGSGFDDF